MCSIKISPLLVKKLGFKGLRKFNENTLKGKGWTIENSLVK